MEGNQETHFRSLVDLLQQRAKYSPDSLAYCFLKDSQSQETRLSYSELDRRARCIGQLLRNQFEPGVRILINHHPGIDYISAFFGCLYAGAIAVPVYPPRFNQKTDRLRSITLDAAPAAALTSRAILESLRVGIEQSPELKALQWIETDSLDSAGAETWLPSSVEPQSIAFLQYTSGSTSEPKGVVLSHRNLLANLESIHEKFELDKDDIGVVWLPPYHDMGLIGGILEPMYGGFPAVLMSPYTFLQRPLFWLQAITKYKGTITGAPNFAYDLCVKRVKEPRHLEGLNLSTVKLAFCGAEPIRPSVFERFDETFSRVGFERKAFYPCYGLAEATLIVSGVKAHRPPTTIYVDSLSLETSGEAQEGSPDNPNTRGFVGCGSAAKHHEIAIVDAKTHRRCVDGHVGEIWFRGPSVAEGYWKREKASQETFDARIANDPQGAPFMRTGDLGFLFGSELYVTGRLKDLLIINGRNIYPQDIEHSVQNAHMALKSGAGAAFSILHQEDERLVIVQELDRNSKEADLDTVVESIREHVFEQHGIRPYAVALIKSNSIPLTSSGKIQRHTARKLFLDNSLHEKKRFVEAST